MDLEGTLKAVGTSADQLGGNVTLGTSGTDPAGTLNTVYGYENVSAADSGTITIGTGAVIDVSGGSAGGRSGGTVDLIAPLLVGGDVNVNVDGGAQIRGQRDFTLEAYARWRTTDAVLPGGGALHFDGIVDPAGLFDANGNPVAANPDHSGFYQTTLMNFVQAPGFSFDGRFAGIANFTARPGIDLSNPSSTINGGAISVLSNWNLGAGSIDSNGDLHLDYRYQGSIAPVLTLRAAGDVNVDASISDGFFQYNNPLGNGAVGSGNSAAPVASAANPLPLESASLDGATVGAGGAVVAADSTSYRIVAGADPGSTDPLALSGSAIVAGQGSVNIDGHTTATYVRNKRTGATGELLAPTMIRTGVGSIDIAAADNVALLDTQAPGVIYTGGRPSAQTAYTPGSTLVVSTIGTPSLIDSGAVNPEAAGDISIVAGNDVIGIEQVTDTNGKLTGKAGKNVSQFWWPWMQQDCVFLTTGCNEPASSSIDFGNFDQGVLSVGGNVSVSAGRDVRDLAVSLPTTWYLSGSGANATVQTVGGGNLTLSAGRNIESGDYFVAKGHGSITAGGSIGADIQSAQAGTVATLLALQDAQLQVYAAGPVNIGRVVDPSYLYTRFDSQSYGADSAVSVTSAGGSVDFSSLVNLTGEIGYGNDTLTPAYTYVLPATLQLSALDGGITVEQRGELYPSATGQLSLIASGDIQLFSGGVGASAANSFFGLIDAPADVLPSPLAPDFANAVAASFIDVGGTSNFTLHSPTPLHAEDAQPVLIYSLDGNLIDGNAVDQQPLTLVADKPALIRAGQDIVNLSFRGQNNYASDVTLIQAGHDIYDTPLSQSFQVPLIAVGGIGTLEVVAGRDIGPITSANEALGAGFLTASNPSYPGIETVGNLYDAFLPHSGADLSLVFGVAQGINLQGFEAAYIDPAGGVAGVPSYSTQLVSFVEQYETDAMQRAGGTGAVTGLSPQDAWTAFQALPAYQQERFVYRVFFDVLNRTGLDFNNPDSIYYQTYSRGYAAINALFPASLGYTANNLTGGVNGAQAPVPTGTLDMRGSTAQTQQGGSITVVGPGGEVLVGSTSAPPNVPATKLSAGIGPNNQGILTLEQGNISIFADTSVLLAQSRIFTEQGGDVLIWSSNGDINAGKGAKTITEIPPPDYVCDVDHFCRVDAKSQVSGAGIAVLQTVPGAPSGSANLIAPRGTVDAGEAGIRVSGNLNVAALRVANADNIQVQGKEVGVPTGVVDTAALSVAASVNAAVEQSATQVAANRPPETAVTSISVEVVGFGQPDQEQTNNIH